MSEKQITITMRFDPVLHRKLKITSALSGRLIKDIVISGVESEINKFLESSGQALDGQEKKG